MRMARFDGSRTRLRPGLNEQPISCVYGRRWLICNLEVAYMNNVIEKTIELKAPVARVWRAISDSREFGEWFRVRFEGPFIAGQVARGQLLYPGYEHLQLEILIKEMQPEKLFSYTWHPYAVDPKMDYSQETPTLVEFSLRRIGAGTRLIVRESGFENVPAARRTDAFRMNSDGWTAQMRNIEGFLARHA
jgi:uncharacterized protein YndB with AHSA1/START domain